MKNWKTVKEASELLGVTKAALYMRIKRGQIDVMKKLNIILVDLNSFTPKKAGRPKANG